MDETTERNPTQPKPSTCYARRHMSMAASTYYEYALVVSHKSGLFYSHDRRDAEQFGEEGVSPTTILSLRSWLENHGWFVPLDKRTKRKRNPTTGLYLPIRYRVLSHDQWVAAHPGKCRFPKTDTVPPAPDSVAGPAPDSVAGEPSPATVFVTTGYSLPIPPATDSVAKSVVKSVSKSEKSSSPECDDDSKFQKAKAKILNDALGPKDQIAAALELIRERTNGKPVSDWKAYLKKSLSAFDWDAARVRLANDPNTRDQRNLEALGLTRTDRNLVAAGLARPPFDPTKEARPGIRFVEPEFGSRKSRTPEDQAEIERIGKKFLNEN